ncbi:MAG: FAD-dependent oxidoreductase [Desulfobulbaceae bacterium]|nr:FAD-dependent oxidoreductase [Desulfobulbaceae bacterium]
MGEKLYQEPAGPVKSSSLLREESIQTSLEDANLVGNIYFANYYKWQGRTRDNFLKEIYPEFNSGFERGGELRCVHCKVNHLNEAMPYDHIIVRMHKKAVHERGVDLFFEYFRVNPDGKNQKIGYGEHRAMWYAPNKQGAWSPADLPVALREALIPKEKQESPGRFIKSKRDRKYDVIVIGAGIGGLTAGALLAKRGKQVLVLEQHTKPGGFCTCWERHVKHNNRKHRFVFEAGVHDIATFGQYSNTLRIFKELQNNSRIEWRRMDHEYFVNGFRIKVPPNLKDYIQVLSEHFPQEQEGLVAFFQEVEICFNELYGKKLGKRSGNRLSVDKWKNVPFLAMLDHYIKDHRLKQVLQILSYYITDDPERLNALVAIPYFGYYMEGGSYPAGGTQVLSDFLADYIRKKSGEVRLKAPVSSILIENGRVKGVKSKDEIFFAEAVISNADVRRTFLELVKREHLSSHYFNRIYRLRPSNSAYTVSLGIDFVPDVNPATFVSNKDGRIAIMIPSKVDVSLAPPGFSCITIIDIMPYEDALTWDRNDPNYVKRKEQYGNKLLRLAETAIPNLREHIIFRQDASPATFARYVWTTGGSIYGLSIDEWKPPMKTPIKGLYLAGAGTTIRPGVEDAISSGIMAADAIESTWNG